MSADRCGKCGEVERYILHTPLVNGACVRSFCDCRSDFEKHHAFVPAAPKPVGREGSERRWTLHCHQGCWSECVCSVAEFGPDDEVMEVVPAAALDAALRDVVVREKAAADEAAAFYTPQIADLQRRLDEAEKLYDAVEDWYIHNSPDGTCDDEGATDLALRQVQEQYTAFLAANRRKS